MGTKEDLAQAGEAPEGDALNMADLADRAFEIVKILERGEGQSKYGKDRTYRWNRVAIVIEEDEGTLETEAFLNGSRVSRQLDWAVHNSQLPMRVRLLRLVAENGSPWSLEFVGKELDGKLKTEVDRPKTKPKVDRKTFKQRIDDPLDYFRLGSGQLDSKAFMQWWEEEAEFTSNDLASVIGKPTMTALEAWFAADPTRTVQMLVDEASGTSQIDEIKDELPFE